MKLRLKTQWAMWILSLSCLLMVTTELAPMAILSTLALDFGQSTQSVAWLVSSYAWIAACAAFVSVFLCARYSAKTILVSLMLLIALSNFLVAQSHDFNLLISFRILGAIAHGGFWALIGAVIYTLVPPEKIGWATAVVFSGVSVASAFGLPLVNYFTYISDWRTVFMCLALFAVVTGILILLLVERIPAQPSLKRDDLIRLLRHRKLMQLMLLTILIISAHFAAFSFVEPLLLAVFKMQGTDLTLLLFYFFCFLTLFIQPQYVGIVLDLCLIYFG